MFTHKEEKKNYISTSEMLDDLGYVTKTPTLGALGQALAKASRENPNCKWLKKHEDKLFKNLRSERKAQKNGN